MQTALRVHLIGLELLNSLPLYDTQRKILSGHQHQAKTNSGHYYLELPALRVQEAERAVARVEIRFARTHEDDVKELKNDKERRVSV